MRGYRAEVMARDALDLRIESYGPDDIRIAGHVYQECAGTRDSAVATLGVNLSWLETRGQYHS